MGIFLSLFLMASAVKDGGATLKDGCSEYSDLVAKLPAGAPLIIRYSLAGESTPCYKVAALVDGKTIDGYLPASSITGLEDFEKGLKDAAWVEASQVIGAIRASQPMGSL